MKRLLTGVAVAALMAAALPALAQSNNPDRINKGARPTAGAATPAPQAQQAAPSDAAAQSGASTPSDNAPASSPSTPSSSSKKHSHAKHQTANARGGRSAADNSAEELNRQELERLSQGGGQGPSNSTQPPSGTSGTSGQRQ